jgi:hypothetical protein
MQDGEQSLRGEWKNDFQKNLDIANVAVGKFCSPEMKKLMNDTGLGNSAVFAKMFYSIGKAMSEDSLVNGENGSGGSSLSLADRLYPKQGK